jgi:hypothetical protein
VRADRSRARVTGALHRGIADTSVRARPRRCGRRACGRPADVGPVCRGATRVANAVSELANASKRSRAFIGYESLTCTYVACMTAIRLRILSIRRVDDDLPSRRATCRRVRVRVCAQRVRTTVELERARARVNERVMRTQSVASAHARVGNTACECALRVSRARVA